MSTNCQQILWTDWITYFSQNIVIFLDNWLWRTATTIIQQFFVDNMSVKFCRQNVYTFSWPNVDKNMSWHFLAGRVISIQSNMSRSPHFNKSSRSTTITYHSPLEGQTTYQLPHSHNICMTIYYQSINILLLKLYEISFWCNTHILKGALHCSWNKWTKIY